MRDPPAQPGDRFEPVHVRHGDVHEDDIGQALAGLGEGFVAVGRFIHHLQIGLRGEVGFNALPDDGVIIDQQDFDSSWFASFHGFGAWDPVRY